MCEKSVSSRGCGAAHFQRDKSGLDVKRTSVAASLQLQAATLKYSGRNALERAQCARAGTMRQSVPRWTHFWWLETDHQKWVTCFSDNGSSRSLYILRKQKGYDDVTRLYIEGAAGITELDGFYRDSCRLSARGDRTSGTISGICLPAPSNLRQGAMPLPRDDGEFCEYADRVELR